jgi:phytoene dehydrogenase-like protein
MSDVLVIGAGPNGLVAATYLAKAGANVTVLEASAMAGGICANRVAVGDLSVPTGPHAFSALDPRVLKDLKLTKRLGFAERDLALTAVRDGETLTLSRDVHECQRSLTQFSETDAERFPAFRREHFAFARAMRALWWDEGAIADEAVRTRLRRMSVTPAAVFLESAFESDAARAAFAFDALAANPSAPGSALVLAWAAAQEMCGLQGAIAVPVGGPAMLVDALLKTAATAGVSVRLNAEVAKLELDGEAVRGAVLTSGETVPGRTILSSLTRKRTLLGFLPPGAAGFAAARRIATAAEVGEAKLVLMLNGRPSRFAQPSRYVIGDKLDTAVAAYGEARSGVVPSDLFLEAVVLEQGEPQEPHAVLLSVRIRPVPIAADWKTLAPHLVETVVRQLAHQAPGLAASITGVGFVAPEPADALCLADMVSPWRTRIATPVRGLYLCGAAAEPMPCVSGRAARIAAAMVVADGVAP